jgi:hypothetical protein
MSGMLMLQVEQHVDRRIDHERDEYHREPLRAELIGDRRAEQSAGNQTERRVSHDVPAHRAVAMMRQRTLDRCKHDRRHRRAERQMHHAIRRETLRVERDHHQRYEDQAAAHTEQACEESGEKPHRGVHQPPDRQFGQGARPARVSIR